MEIEEIISIHASATKKIYLLYKKKQKIGICYIDPGKCLNLKREGVDGYGLPLETWPEKALKEKNIQVGVYKSISDSLIFVNPVNLYFQSEKKAKISKILYGKRND